MTTPAERAKEWIELLERASDTNSNRTNRSIEVMQALLASLESVTRDAEVMAEHWLTYDNGDHGGSCTCHACTVARKYTK